MGWQAAGNGWGMRVRRAEANRLQARARLCCSAGAHSGCGGSSFEWEASAHAQSAVTHSLPRGGAQRREAEAEAEAEEM